MRPELLDALSFAVRVLRMAGTDVATNFRKATRFDLLIRANGTEAEFLALSREVLEGLPRLGTRYCAVREIIRVIRRAEMLEAYPEIPEEDRDELRTIMVDQDLTLKEARRRLALDRAGAVSISKGWTG